jgi:hypothetical protein
MKVATLTRLRAGVAAFLGLTPNGAPAPGGLGIQVVPVSRVREKGSPAPFPVDLAVPQLQELQADARAFLEGAADGTGARLATVMSDEQETVADVVMVGSTRRLRIGGSLRAGFLWTLAFVVAGPAGRRLRACPQCGTLFVRTRRQIRCSDRCTDQANWASYSDEAKRQWPSRKKAYEENGWTLGARTSAKKDKATRTTTKKEGGR